MSDQEKPRFPHQESLDVLLRNNVIEFDSNDVIDDGDEDINITTYINYRPTDEYVIFFQGVSVYAIEEIYYDGEFGEHNIIFNDEDSESETLEDVNDLIVYKLVNLV